MRAKRVIFLLAVGLSAVLLVIALLVPSLNKVRDFSYSETTSSAPAALSDTQPTYSDVKESGAGYGDGYAPEPGTAPPMAPSTTAARYRMGGGVRTLGGSSSELALARGDEASVELFNVSADEIWVIAKSETQAVPRGEETPGCGAMLAKLPKDRCRSSIPM